MTLEENKTVVRRFFDELVNGNKRAIAEEIFDPDFIMPQSGLRGLDGARQMVDAIHAAFPDARDTIEEQIAEGDKVLTRITVKATHTGTWYGLPPTGKAVKWTGVIIDRLINGKIVERIVVVDWLSVMEQLGFSVTATPL